jgi:hypothetical protein
MTAPTSFPSVPYKGKGKLYRIIVFYGDGFWNWKVKNGFFSIIYKCTTGNHRGLAPNILGAIWVSSGGGVTVSEGELAILHGLSGRSHVFNLHPQVVNGVFIKNRNGGDLKFASEEIVQKSC